MAGQGLAARDEWSYPMLRARASEPPPLWQPAATRKQKPAACGSTPPSAGRGGLWERQAAWLLVPRAFRATVPAELQELLRADGVAAPDDPAMQELAPLVAAVQTLPPVTRQQLLQLWQDTLQLVQGGSGPRPQAAQARDAGAVTAARTPAA